MNFKEYRDNWEIAKSGHLTNIPLHIDLELNSTCNLRCGFCYYSNGFSDHGIMNEDLANSIIDQAGMMGVPAMKFQYRGEPTLHRDLEKYIARSKNVGIIDTMINTNGNCSICKLTNIIDAGLDSLIFSVDAFSKDTYDQIRHSGNYELVENNILRCLKYTKTNNLKCKIKVQFVQTTINQHEAEDFKNFWEEQGAEVRISICMPRGGKDTALEIGCDGNRQYCGFPNQRMTILYDGTVLPCCAMIDREYPIGDANKESLFQIWHSEKVNNLRNNLLAGNYDVLNKCKNCSCAGSYKE